MKISSLKFRATVLIFKTLPKEMIAQIGENSPNLVSLFTSKFFHQCRRWQFLWMVGVGGQFFPPFLLIIAFLIGSSQVLALAVVAFPFKGQRRSSLFFASESFLSRKFFEVSLSESLLRCLLLQGCQMAYFQTKNPNLGKFWGVLQ
jgi:hypothetical protein